jgi:hypothetical protein
MKHYQLTNGRKVNGYAVYDLYCGGNVVMAGALYRDAFDHVLDNGADADTYQEQHMSKPQTVAELRTERDAQDRWFAQH